MAVLNSLQTIATDDKPAPGYFNDIFSRFKKFVFTDSTTDTVTSSTPAVVKTGTLTPDDTSDNLVYMVRAQYTLVNNEATSENVYGRIDIGGETVQIKNRLGGNGETSYDEFFVLGAQYTNFGGASNNGHFQIDPASSYAVEFYLYNGDNAASVSVKDVTLTIYVLQGPIDSESPSFG